MVAKSYQTTSLVQIIVVTNHSTCRYQYFVLQNEGNDCHICITPDNIVSIQMFLMLQTIWAIMPLKNNQVFIAQSSMFDNFIKQINRTSQSKTKGWSGKLMLAGVRTVGLGGGILLKYG